MAVALNNVGAPGTCSATGLLRTGTVHNLSGVMIGVNKDGRFIQASFSQTPSTITAEEIGGRRYVVYPIDQILLPVDPAGLTSPLCSS